MHECVSDRPGVVKWFVYNWMEMSKKNHKVLFIATNPTNLANNNFQLNNYIKKEEKKVFFLLLLDEKLDTDKY